MRIALTSLFLMLLSNSLFALEFTADPNTVALWNFNEGSGSVLNDSSGNGNNGTISGATWFTDEYGTGLDFDGVDDYVSFTSALQNDGSNWWAGNFTFEFWIRIESGESQDHLFTMANGNGEVNHRYLGSWHNHTDATWRYTGLGSSSRSAYYGKLVYMAHSHDASTGEHKFYVNGVLRDSNVTALDFLNPSNTGRKPAFGAYDNGSGFERFHGGEIYSCKISNSILSGDSLLVLHNFPPEFGTLTNVVIYKDSLMQYAVDVDDANGDSLLYSLVSYPSGMTINASSGIISWTPSNVAVESVTVKAQDSEGLYDVCSFVVEVVECLEDSSIVAHWDFNEGSGDTIFDKSGYGNHGTIYEGGVWVGGIEGNALKFDGNYIIVPDDPSLDVTDDFTIEMWFKGDPSTLGDGVNRNIFSKGSFGTITTAGLDYQLVIRNNSEDRLIWGCHSALDISPLPAAIFESSWHYFAFTFNSDSYKSEFYCDGVLVESIIDTELSYTPNDWPLHIGARREQNVAESSPRYTGKLSATLDEVRISNVVRDSSEIAAHWEANNERATLLASWNFNENTGDTLFDESIYQRHGTISGATWTSGIDGSALSFDGVNDYVYLGDDIFSGNEGTIEAWILLNSRDIQNPILSMYQADASSNGMFVYIHGNDGMIEGQLHFGHDTRTCGGDMVWTGAEDTLEIESWYHIAVTSDGTVTRLYLNGVEQEYQYNDTNGKWFNDLCNNKSVYIGRRFRTASDDYFDGAIDEVKVWSYALDQPEIAAHWDDYSDKLDLVAHWTFDEGSGDTLYDHSLYGNDGIITGASWVPGISGSALDFDGVDDYVNILHDNSLNVGTGSFTIEAWIKDAVKGSSFSEGVIVDKRDESAYWIGHRFSITDEDIRIAHDPGLTITASLTETLSVNDGAWHYLVAVKDVNYSANGSLLLYVDGQLVKTIDKDDSGGAITAMASLDHMKDLQIGGKILDGVGNVETCLDGILDEIKIHRVAISASEISANWDAEVPVELSSFTGAYSSEEIVLSWTTQSEQDNLGWNILRADSPAGSFMQVNGSLIPGADTSSEPHEYSYTDATATDGAYYYKLEQVDHDGSKDYSQVVSVEMNASGIHDVSSEIGRATSSKFMFDINGEQVSGRESGVYIVREGEKLKKVLFVK